MENKERVILGRAREDVLNMMDRRHFLLSAACGAGALGAPWTARAANAEIVLTPVDPGSALITGAGGNIFATRAGEGVVLVDTGSADAIEEVLARIDAHFGGAPVLAAFNTHWHYDHTGGNAAVRARGAKIYAHENTRLWLSGDFESPWQDRHYRPQPEAALPTDTFYTDGSVRIGDREIHYGHLKQAHTDGDVYVHFRDAEILAAGGLVTSGYYPILDYATGGWIGAMENASEALLQVAGENTRIVPEKGPLVGRDHLEAQHQMLDTVKERLFELVRLGRGAEEMLAAGVTAEFDAEWGDPTLFVTNAYPGMWAHSYEVGGVV